MDERYITIETRNTRKEKMSIQHAKDIREFIMKNLLKSNREPLSNDELLIESGIIDSYGIVEIVVFIESEYEISLLNEDLIIDNFNSVDDIARMIDQKLS